MFKLQLTLIVLVAATTTTFAASDVSLRVSQDVLNSASSVYFDAGVLSYVGELSINHKIQTTNVFETLWPKAYEVCKNCPLLFTLKATTKPTATITSEGAVVTVNNANLIMVANDTINGNHPLLTLGINATCGLNFSSVPKSAGEFLTAQISILKLHTLIESSQAGLFPKLAIPILNVLVQGLLEDAASAFNNKFPGIPIPSIPFINVSNVLISTNGGYLDVSLDITPTMPPLPPGPSPTPGPSPSPDPGPSRHCAKIHQDCSSHKPGSGPGVTCCKGLVCKTSSSGNKCYPPSPAPGPQCKPNGDRCRTKGDCDDPTGPYMCCCGDNVCLGYTGVVGTFCQKPSSTIDSNTSTITHHQQLTSRGRLLLKKPNTTNVDANPPGFSGPGFTATLGGPALTKILTVIVQEITHFVNEQTINIPPCYRDSCGIGGGKDPVQLIINPDGRGHGTEGDIPIRGFKIGTSKIAFVEGKGIQVTLGELYFDLPPTGFRIAKNIGPAKPHCSGHFSGSLSNMQVVETVMIKDTSGKPTATESSSWSWGQGVKFDVSMTHNFCKFIKNIAQWFIGNINQLVVDKIKDLLPPALDKLMKTSLNDLLQGLVLKTKIDNYASIEFGLTQNPSFANNALEVFLSGQVVKT